MRFQKPTGKALFSAIFRRQLTLNPPMGGHSRGPAPPQIYNTISFLSHLPKMEDLFPEQLG